jgi:hypothetical protein
VLVASAALLIAAAPAAGAAPGEDPSAGQRSNLGLCSPYLASLDAPVIGGEALGGNARSGVNLLIKLIGPTLPDELDSPGELYRIRAHQHPDAPASIECVPRPPTP